MSKMYCISEYLELSNPLRCGRVGYEYDMGGSLQELAKDFMNREDRDRCALDTRNQRGICFGLVQGVFQKTMYISSTA